jgi:hypothetical protein
VRRPLLATIAALFVFLLVALVLVNVRSCGKAAAVGPASSKHAPTAVPGAVGDDGRAPRLSYPTRTPRTTYLPQTNKAVNDYINAMNSEEWRWYRSDIEFKIGFELYLKTCMRGVPDGTMFDYILQFSRVDDSDEFIATIEFDEINGGMNERKITDEQWRTFSACADDYLATHTWSAADYTGDETKWGSGTYFPIGAAPLYRRLKSMGVDIPGL